MPERSPLRPVGAPDQWPLVGRSVEVEFGVHLLVEAGRCLVISGVAGVGKSRLAAEIARRAADAVAGAVVQVAATDAPTAQLAPLLAAAGLLGAGDGDGVETFMGRIVDAVLTVGGGHGVVLVVDDAHHLDDLSAAAVRQLSVAGLARIVATVRAGESVAGDLAALWRNDGGERLELQPLSELELRELAGAVLDAPLSAESAHLLAEYSGGNCLALRELLVDGVESGRLRLERGVYHWLPTGQVGRRLVDLVDSWVGSLGAGERAVVLATALAGRASRAALVELGDEPGLRRLEVRGALTVDRDEVTLGHPLYGEVARARAGDDEIREVLSQLVRAFVGLALDGRRPTATIDVLKVGHWLGELAPQHDAWRRLCDDVADHRELLAGAAEHAVRLGDVEAASGLAAAAVECGVEVACAALAEALERSGRPDDAARALDRFWAVTSPVPVPTLRRAAQTDLTLCLLHRRDLVAAEHAVARALDRLGQAGCVADDVTFIHAMHASYLTMIGELGGAEPLLAELDSHDPATRLRAVAARVSMLVGAGRCREAVALADEALAAALGERAAVPEGLRWSISALAGALLVGGDLSRIAELSALGRDVAAPDSEGGAFRALANGRAALLAGRADVAVTELADAAGWYERHRQEARLRWALALLAEAYALLGDHVASERAAAEARDLEPGGALFEHDADRALAWAAASAPGSSPGVAAVLVVADRARDLGLRPLELLTLWDGFRLGARSAVRRRLVALAPTVDSVIGDLVAAVVRASDGDALDSAAGALADAGFVLWAAETARLAAGAHTLESNRAAARRSCLAAHRWWTDLGCPDSPAMAGFAESDGSPPALLGLTALTAREAEVAALAADGMASRAIADVLGVSPRTVDNLLGRVYAKLGIGGRPELADQLGRPVDVT